MRARLSLVVSLAALALILSAGCERKTEPGGATPGAGPEPGITVKLLEPGAEPRQALRYRFTSRAPVTMEMTMEMGMAIGVSAAGHPEAKQPEMILPTMKMLMVLTPTEVRADGTLRYTFGLEKTEVVPGDQANPVVLESLKAELKKTEGMSGWALVDARGFTREADVTVPPGASPQVKDMVDKMRQQMRQMSAPFAEEKVGVGARWEVRMPISTEMFSIDQVATYRLTRLEGNVAEMEVEVTQTAAPQDVKVPNLPTAKGRLLEMSSSGSGTMRVDLGQLVPTSRMSNKTHLVMELRMGDQAPPQRVTTDMTLRLGISAK